MELPEHRSHTIERLLDRNLEKYNKGVIDYFSFLRKVSKVIEYGFREKYLENLKSALNVLDKLDSSKKFRKEDKYYRKLEQEEARRRYETGPLAIPVISQKTKKFLFRKFKEAYLKGAYKGRRSPKNFKKFLFSEGRIS